jgi:hypothetical protein
MQFISAVNQPTRVFVNSSDDPTNDPTSNESYGSFRINFNTGILKPKQCQLTRATIPNTELSIPNYQLVFWYIRIPSVGAPEYKYVRFLPSNFDRHDPDQELFGLPTNRLIANYQDFVDMLNQAAAAVDDVLNVDPDTAAPLHVAGDVTFAYDALSRRITMTGTNAGYTYFVPGYTDPEVLRLSPFVKLRYIYATVLVSTSVQPFLPQLPMSLRVGFCSQNTDIENQRATGVPVYPTSWGDLVYSGNVYIYSNIVQGGSLGSQGQRNLLAVIPTNAPPLGVIAFTAPMAAPLTRIVQEIFEVQILMFDDNNQPFEVQNNATTTVELSFAY